MEVYKDISNSQNEEFKKLLIDRFSKSKIEEGKLLTGIVTKITEKYVYLLIDGMKSEALIDFNEVKTTYPEKKLKENDKLEVYLEKIEDKNGEVIVSVSRAQKIRGWYILEKAYEANENRKGKIISRTKGGAIVKLIDAYIRDPGGKIKPYIFIHHKQIKQHINVGTRVRFQVGEFNKFLVGEKLTLTNKKND